CDRNPNFRVSCRARRGGAGRGIRSSANGLVAKILIAHTRESPVFTPRGYRALAGGRSGLGPEDQFNPETTWDHKNQTRAALGGKRSFACGRSNDNVAPIPVVRLTTVGPLKSNIPAITWDSRRG